MKSLMASPLEVQCVLGQAHLVLIACPIYANIRKHLRKVKHIGQAMKSINRLRCAGTAILLALGSVIPVDAQVSPSGQAPPSPCEVGSYLMADGTSLDIGPGAPGQLRWRRLDGRTGALIPQGNGRWTSTLGWTDRSDGHQVTISDCTRGE